MLLAVVEAVVAVVAGGIEYAEVAVVAVDIEVSLLVGIQRFVGKYQCLNLASLIEMVTCSDWLMS